MSDTCGKQVQNALMGLLGVCLVRVTVCHQKSVRVSCVFWLKIFLNMLKNFLEAWHVSGMCLIHFDHMRYKRIEYTLNAFGTCFRHASVRYTSILILRNISAVTYPKPV